MYKKEFTTILFYCDNFDLGGTETLILRLGNFYRTEDFRVVLATKNPVNNRILDLTLSMIPEYYSFNFSKSDFYSGNKILQFSRQESVIVITEFLPEFFKSFNFFNSKKYNVKFNHIIYIVHPKSTFYGPKVLNFLVNIMYKIFNERKILSFMDEHCIEVFKKHYKLSSLIKYHINRLPIIIQENHFNGISNDLNILSISRFEFPFKGYLLGLIKAFEKVYTLNRNMTLTIIGYGKDRQELIKIIDSLDSKISDKIFLMSEVSNLEISEYIKNCDVYVGMGTTILDAANQSKVCITAVGYQNEEFAIGFFHEKFNSVGETYSVSSNYTTLSSLLKEILNLDKAKFEEYSVRSKQRLIENYDIRIIAKNLININQNNFSKAEINLIKFLSKMYHFANWVNEKKRSIAWTQ